MRNEFEVEYISDADKHKIIFASGYIESFVAVKKKVYDEEEIFIEFMLDPTKYFIEEHNIKPEEFVNVRYILSAYPEHMVFNFFVDREKSRYLVFCGFRGEATEFSLEESRLIEQNKSLDKDIKNLRMALQKKNKQISDLIENPVKFLRNDIKWIKEAGETAPKRQSEDDENENI